jgi:hypothetical protein
MTSGRKTKKLKPDDKEQSTRFIETVERIGLVENPEESFGEAFKRVVKTKPRKTTASKE